MAPFVVLFILILILVGAGFALHILWIVAVVALVLWLVGLVLNRRA